MKKKSILETLNEIKDLSNSRLLEIYAINKDIAKIERQREYKQKIILKLLNPIVKKLVNGLNIIPEKLLRNVKGTFFKDQIIYYFKNVKGDSVEVRCPIEHINDYLLSKKLYKLVFFEYTKFGNKAYHLIPSDESEQYFEEI